MNLWHLRHSRSLLKKVHFLSKLFDFISSFSAFWTISQPLDFHITFCWTNDLGLPLIPSTISFPWEVAKYFHINGVLHLMKTIFIRCRVYLFLNSEERPLLHITSELMPFINGMCWSYKWNKKATTVSLFFLLNQNKLKMSCRYHHKWWQQPLGLHNADCTSVWYSQE